MTSLLKLVPVRRRDRARAHRRLLRKLDPRKMIRNPVMFVSVGSAFTTLLLHAVITGQARLPRSSSPCRCGCVTVLFANFAEAMARPRKARPTRSANRART